MSFLLLMDGTFILMLSGFNVWHWLMCMSGFTTIEFVKRINLELEMDLFDFSFPTARDNLFVVFGTTKLLRVLSPSMRSLPFSGLEWSFSMKE